MWFIEDEAKTETERQVVTFMDVISNLGGIMKFFLFAGYVLTWPI
jgi:hypothetical protein